MLAMMCDRCQGRWVAPCRGGTLDDQLHAHPKIKRAWKCRPALGLHVMALSYSGCFNTQGFVPADFVEEKLPAKKERERATGVLVEAALWEPVERGWQIHDWGVYNGKDAAKSAAGKKGATARWGDGTSHAVANGKHDGGANSKEIAPRARAAAPGSGSGKEEPERSEEKDKVDARTFDEWLLDHSVVTGRKPPKAGTQARDALAGMFRARVSEGYSLAELKLATRAAHANEFRRTNGHDKPESVLRPTKVHGLIEDGRQSGGALAAVEACPAVDAVAEARWVAMTDTVRAAVDEATFDMWLAPLHPHCQTGDSLVLGAPPETRGWVADRFRKVLEEAAGGPVEIVACSAAKRGAA